jgi:hypothetical protein
MTEPPRARPIMARQPRQWTPTTEPTRALRARQPRQWAIARARPRARITTTQQQRTPGGGPSAAAEIAGDDAEREELANSFEQGLGIDYAEQGDEEGSEGSGYQGRSGYQGGSAAGRAGKDASTTGTGPDGPEAKDGGGAPPRRRRTPRAATMGPSLAIGMASHKAPRTVGMRATATRETTVSAEPVAFSVGSSPFPRR